MLVDIIQFLKEKRVSHEILTHSTPTTTIEETAKQRGITPDIMVKSMLLRDMDDNFVLACVPGDKQVDPKKVRALLKCRRMTCASVSEVTAITGYEIGTIAPLLLSSPIPIFFDSSLQSKNTITISSGNKLAGISLNILDLMRLCAPRIADISKD